MNLAPDNPPQNTLKPGTKEQDVADAIAKSGYPLQLVAARQLRKSFDYVQEEWPFVDADTKELRSLDLVARRQLWDKKKNQPRVRPEVALLLECKQSELPYVFFLTEPKQWIPEFPYLAGLNKYDIHVTTDDTRSTWTLRTMEALGLNRHPFCMSAPAYGCTFSKAVRKGKTLELSGADPYASIVYPLLKATRHLRAAEQPPKTAHYFDCTMSIPVALIDGPMVGVRITDTGQEMVSVPWVRLIRHHYEETAQWHSRSEAYAIECIHRDYLDTYINKYLLPFAREFARVVLKHPDELADGKGFISGLEKDSWDKLETRLRRNKARK